MNAWLFHANNGYILTEKVPPLLGQVETWDAMTNFKRIEAGDKVVLWQSAVGGLAPGIYALGEVDGRPYMYVGDDYWRVDIRYTQLLKCPLLKQQLLDDPLLGTLLVIKNPNAANPSHVTTEQWTAVEGRAGQVSVVGGAGA
jgi:hypothetical protein